MHFTKSIAPDQNRTDTRSLEGYCSTIELQAQKVNRLYGMSVFFDNELMLNIKLKL